MAICKKCGRSFILNASRGPAPWQSGPAFVGRCNDCRAGAGAAGKGNDRKPLTPRQAQMLRFVYTFTKRHGYAPTYREIGQALGIRSPNGVWSVLVPLARKGFITMPIRTGGARLSGRGVQARSVRILGLRWEPLVEAGETGRRVAEALGIEVEGGDPTGKGPGVPVAAS